MNCVFELYRTTDDGVKIYACRVCRISLRSKSDTPPEHACNPEGNRQPIVILPRPPRVKPDRKPPDPDAAKKRAARLAQEQADALAGAEAIGDVSLLDKGRHYATALAKWFRAGCPTRTPEEAARIELICHSCKHYDAKEEACKICGCKVSAARWAIASKSKMATEKCPRGFWE